MRWGTNTNSIESVKTPHLYLNFDKQLLNKIGGFFLVNLTHWWKREYFCNWPSIIKNLFFLPEGNSLCFYLSTLSYFSPLWKITRKSYSKNKETRMRRLLSQKCQNSLTPVSHSCQNSHGDLSSNIILMTYQLTTRLGLPSVPLKTREPPAWRKWGRPNHIKKPVDQSQTLQG